MNEQQLFFKKRLACAYDEARKMHHQAEVNPQSTNIWHVALIRTRLIQIEKALRRLEHGGFGICQQCDHPIKAKRLRLLPYTELCVMCQREQERIKQEGVTLTI